MKKINKSYPYILTFFAFIIALVIWDYIKLPYDENNIVQGTALIKKINPYDNTLKVIFSIFFPLGVFLITYLLNYKVFGVIPYQKNFFLNSNNCNKNHNKFPTEKINIFTFFLISLLIIEFLSLDFSVLLSPVDIYHDGLILVPSYNFLIFKKYWISTHFDWGLGANLRPILIWKILGFETIGAARFFDQSIILLNKIILIFICRKISLLLTNKNIYQLLFFLLLSFSSIQLSNYFVSLTGTGGSPIPLRLVFFLLFFLFLIESFSKKNIYIKVFLLGFFSSISFIWFTDIAFYTNTILLIYLLLLIFVREFKKVFIIFSGAGVSWVLFFLYFGPEEMKEFFFQIRSNFNFIYYFNFLEFPKPFSDHYGSSRALKSLLLIIINGIVCLNLCLDKNKKLTFEMKMLLVMTFIASIVLFKSALVRADIYHIRYASGFTFFLFILNFFLIIFYKLGFKKISLSSIHFDKNYFFIALIIVATSCFFFLKHDQSSIQRLASAKENIKLVLLKNDNSYLNFKPGMWNYGRKYSELNFDEDKKFINHYKSLTKKDKCVQNFTEYLSLSYFLKKPTCTKFYNAQFIQHKITEDNFIYLFKQNLPNYILYSSPIVHLDKYGNKQQESLLKGMPDVDKFIKKNYFFYESYLGKWTILKKN